MPINRTLTKYLRVHPCGHSPQKVKGGFLTACQCGQPRFWKAPGTPCLDWQSQHSFLQSQNILWDANVTVIVFYWEERICITQANWRGSNPSRKGPRDLAERYPGSQCNAIFLCPSSPEATRVTQVSQGPDFWPLETLLRPSTMRRRRVRLLGHVKAEKVEGFSPPLMAPQSPPIGLLPGVYLVHGGQKL